MISVPQAYHSFMRVSLAHVTKNLSAENSRELAARKKYKQTTTNTCFYSATHTLFHSLGWDNVALQYSAPKHAKNTPSCSRIFPPWMLQLEALFLSLYLLFMPKNVLCKIVVATHTNLLSLAYFIDSHTSPS
jgi:hypothetical protein